jgi:hypothetical protein
MFLVQWAGRFADARQISSALGGALGSKVADFRPPYDRTKWTLILDRNSKKQP